MHNCVVYMVQTLSNCKIEVCKAIGMALDQCQLSMGMSGDFEQAVSYIPYRGVIFVNLHPDDYTICPL